MHYRVYIYNILKFIFSYFEPITFIFFKWLFWFGSTDIFFF
jgi:hypothetical protein